MTSLDFDYALDIDGNVMAVLDERLLSELISYALAPPTNEASERRRDQVVDMARNVLARKVVLGVVRHDQS